jgi:hypothetical protein
MSGPLALNAKPLNLDLGSLGKWYIGGVASGLGLWQNDVPENDRYLADLSNGQMFIGKPDGLVRVFAQIGAYSLPALGVPYMKAATATTAFFGPFPEGFVKVALGSDVAVSAGKLPTLAGAEDTFSFENMNIQRGLLWNQENAVNRGVQVDYSRGPIALAFAWNDGFYSGEYSWAWLSATWTIDKGNTLAFIGGGNTRHVSVSSAATPLFQNNEQIYNLIYTHTAGGWTIKPYLQYTHVPRIRRSARYTPQTPTGWRCS